MTMETAVLSELQSRFYLKDTIQDNKIFLRLSITQTSQRTLLFGYFSGPILSLLLLWLLPEQ